MASAEDALNVGSVSIQSTIRRSATQVVESEKGLRDAARKSLREEFKKLEHEILEVGEIQ